MYFWQPPSIECICFWHPCPVSTWFVNIYTCISMYLFFSGLCPWSIIFYWYSIGMLVYFICYFRKDLTEVLVVKLITPHLGNVPIIPILMKTGKMIVLWLTWRVFIGQYWLWRPSVIYHGLKLKVSDKLLVIMYFGCQILFCFLLICKSFFLHGDVEKLELKNYIPNWNCDSKSLFYLGTSSWKCHLAKK